MKRAVGAGSLSADTSPQGTGQVTRSPPTGRTHPPSRQSESSVAGAQSLSPWQHTPAVAPLDPQPQASCLAGNRDWEPPRRTQGTMVKVLSTILCVLNFNFNGRGHMKTSGTFLKKHSE